MGCVCMTGIVEVVAAADGTQTVADFHDTQARGNALAVDDPHDFVPPDRRPRLAARGQSGVPLIGISWKSPSLSRSATQSAASPGREPQSCLVLEPDL
jgi:hypothetical protein